MNFTFELYRAKSKQKGATPATKLILTSNDNFHYKFKGNKVKKLRELACQTIVDSGVALEGAVYTPARPCGVTLTVFFPSKRKSDVDNLQPTLKAILDGFTDAGLWNDDNHQTLYSTKYVYGGLSGSDAYRLDISIEDEAIRKLY